MGPAAVGRLGARQDRSLPEGLGGPRPRYGPPVEVGAQP
jgi:hypothetical protein